MNKFVCFCTFAVNILYNTMAHHSYLISLRSRKKKRSSITPEKSSSNKEKRVITIVLCEKNLETGNISLKDLKVLYIPWILRINLFKPTNPKDEVV